MSKTFDFRTGRNNWGHALHGSTMRAVNAPSFWWKVKDWAQGASRYAFLVHCTPTPREGDRIVWSSENGQRSATVYDVRHLMDPRDMSELFVRITPSGRAERFDG